MRDSTGAGRAWPGQVKLGRRSRVGFCSQTSGGDEEDRTPDLRIANATLSQLSYVPTDASNSSSAEAQRDTGFGAPCTAQTGGERSRRRGRSALP